MIILKSCPFCGGKAEMAIVPEGFAVGRWVYIRCRKCGAGTKPSREDMDAINAWNRRVTKEEEAVT